MEVSGEETQFTGEKRNLWEVISHEINTAMVSPDIIIFAQWLSECNNLSSGGTDHRRNL